MEKNVAIGKLVVGIIKAATIFYAGLQVTGSGWKAVLILYFLEALGGRKNQ